MLKRDESLEEPVIHSSKWNEIKSTRTRLTEVPYENKSVETLTEEEDHPEEDADSQE